MRTLVFITLAFLASACSAELVPGTNAVPPTAADASQAADQPPTPTCTDGQLNGMETGVDCGGPCSPCAIGGGCSAPTDCASGLCRKQLCSQPGWLLGKGGDADAATWTVVLDKKLATPSALAFNPNQPGELWVVNRKDDSVTILPKIGAKPVRYADQALHFLEFVDAIAFSDNGTFATCGDSSNEYHGNGEPNGFMGPVLWPADLSDFESLGPDAAKVHLDMMHDTPNCMGIAAATGNTYFVFNGLAGSIDRYDFGEPHVNGGTDHTDGGKLRYKGLGLKRVEGVPSHLAFDASTGMLFVADTGNGRVMRLDTETGSVSGKIKQYKEEVKLQVMTGATAEVLIGDGLQQPSGLLLYEGFLYVADAASGQLHAFTLEGVQVNQIDTGLGEGHLAGIAVGPDERLYLVDRTGNQVLRLDP